MSQVINQSNDNETTPSIASIQIEKKRIFRIPHPEYILWHYLTLCGLTVLPELIDGKCLAKKENP